MRIRFLCAVSVVGLMMGCAGQSMEDLGGKASPSLGSRDNDWFKTITAANETEIQTSRLALTQSQNDSVKNFAQHMIDDHMMAEQKVGALAAEKGVTLPSKLDTTHQAMLDGLKSKSGTDFDKAYVDLQVQAHKETISADQDEANNATDADVKSMAGELVGKLQSHLSMAEDLQHQMM